MSTEKRGNSYQVKCVSDVIKGKEKRGEDASFERGLLESWSKYEGWEDSQKHL